MTKIRILWRFQWLKYFLFLITFFLVNYSTIFSWQLLGDIYSYSPIVLSQTILPEKVAKEVYEKNPQFPLENNYISLSNNERAIDNTLVSRIVRYHQYIKARPTIYRLDWKLTLADFLGKNEIIREESYPGYSTLTQNPFKGDRKVIENLTMKQRNELVNILVSIYNPTVEKKPAEKPSQNQKNKNSPPVFVLPTPGGADLLKP